MLTKDKISDIYKLHSLEIYRYLYKLSGNTHAAEDLLQEVFEKFIAYTAEKEIQEEKFRSFLYKTAHNLCINYLIRQNRTHPGSIDDMEDTLKTEDPHHERMIMDELNQKIYKILEKVEPESCSIFIMHKENGMNYDEIARHLSVSARTVRRRIKSVIDIIYKELKKEGFIA
jgi:RNA polymerase sigma-70 factor (ECF subfamily)